MVDQIVFLSYETYPMNQTEVHEVLSSSQTKNTELGLSGAVYYKNGFFLHILEGELEKIVDVFKGTANGQAWHHKVRVLGKGFSPKRDFAGFTAAIGGGNFKKSNPDEIWNLLDSILGDRGEDLALAKTFLKYFCKDINAIQK